MVQWLRVKAIYRGFIDRGPSYIFFSFFPKRMKELNKNVKGRKGPILSEVQQKPTDFSDPKPPTYSYKPDYGYRYGGYPKPGYTSGYKPKPAYYYPNLHYYQPNPAQTANLFDLFYKNPAFKNAYLGHHFSKAEESGPAQLL